ncbi:MAG: BON domain-containing protein [Chloroflexota bacterium]|nr:BON domain-containing protein [Dehalococcoidales bacterium]
MPGFGMNPGEPSMGNEADRELTKRVRRALGDSLELQRHPINVSAHDGVVELSGEVPSAGLRQLAEELAISAPGVREIRNHILVEGERD